MRIGISIILKKKESKRLKSKAHQILVTLKPATSWSARRMIAALIINRKSPNVTMVTGNVSMTRIGFTKKLRRLSTTATMMAVM